MHTPESEWGNNHFYGKWVGKRTAVVQIFNEKQMLHLENVIFEQSTVQIYHETSNTGYIFHLNVYLYWGGGEKKKILHFSQPPCIHVNAIALTCNSAT